MNYQEQAYREITSVDVPEEKHKAEWTHQIIAGAAAFEAMRLYNKKQAEEGPIDDHHLAKEIIAGLAGASVDHFAETKGIDWVDRQKAKHAAKEDAEKLYTQQTGYEF
ncbi:hypothetical protein J3Q64DRAFT_1629259 [Phycomyces blakesleeanus]|uniref:CipC-like antibiotic response protein n=2 Tax=Phycomyces blakesleeanus TaxID=4837 RepID=A0A162Q3B5_PHYB8|nr:hypothetical protein PHYBLDRAFT_121290 [Phycomyces blakesleeanus NRRL 1555(-)]OAD79636.1 hypothetical protein PHYBLDRAFT_121290 [Phycomyces blakesleeanus NRRL 1555(-)]|eukprot:XP_018297676.1 hypothetical protein PHYBLDRAFT_121290 [Phycomyces blakesleeanus NRRL 1555(-)]